MIKIHQDHRDYGYCQMNQELSHHGILVNKKKVLRLLKKIGIMENFFSILKQELYHGVIYKSYQELKQAIENYIEYYNHSRI